MPNVYIVSETGTAAATERVRCKDENPASVWIPKGDGFIEVLRQIPPPAENAGHHDFLHQRSAGY
jgi:hypothetical protein